MCEHIASTYSGPGRTIKILSRFSLNHKMNSIRKLKRYNSHAKKPKASTKLSLGEIVFYIGIATILAGIFYGIYNYCIYTSGRPEQTAESKGGPIYHPEEDPGNTGRKESAATGWKIAGIGIVLIVLSMIISIIDEVLHDAIGKFHGRTGRKRHMRRVK